MDASDQNVYEYLKVVAARKDDTLEQLYANAGACRCIFESLPELAKQYVMRLVPCGDLWVELDKWLAEGASFDQHRTACQRLSELRVMEKRQQSGSGEEYRLHAGFRGQMLEWLCGSEQGRWKGGDSKSSKDEGTTIEMMHAKASLKWEKVLQFMLSGGEPPSATVVDVLRRLKVMEQNQDGSHTITADGYSFLLHDLSTQLWLFVRKYIESASERGQAIAAFTSEDPRWTRGCVTVDKGKSVVLVDRAPVFGSDGHSWWKVKYDGVLEEMPTVGKVPAECIMQQSAAEMLIFLFQMSFVQLGQDVAIDQLSPSQLQFKEELADIGLIYRRKSNSRRFYATSLALQLATYKGGGGGGFGAGDESEGLPTEGARGGALGAALGGEAWSVIVESNFKVYAYTASEHIVLLLNLFMRVEYLLPNLCVGSITRESVNAAFVSPTRNPHHNLISKDASDRLLVGFQERGITARQICSFLSNHAHDRMLSSRPVVPETVVDQVMLWEAEQPNHRIKHEEAVLYDSWPNAQVFRLAVQKAKEKGVHKWSSECVHSSSLQHHCYVSWLRTYPVSNLCIDFCARMRG